MRDSDGQQRSPDMLAESVSSPLPIRSPWYDIIGLNDVTLCLHPGDTHFAVGCVGSAKISPSLLAVQIAAMRLLPSC
jgi:hypothetical protein